MATASTIARPAAKTGVAGAVTYGESPGAGGGESGNGSPRVSTATPTQTAQTAQAVKAPPFQIASIQSSKRFIKLFIYGNYGVGKTALAGSSALVKQMRDVLMIDAEAGDLTLATTDDKASILACEHTDVVRVSTFKELARVHEYLKLHCKLRDDGNLEELKKLEQRLFKDFNPDSPPRQYRTVIIDSLTEVETFSMYQLLGISDLTRLDEETQSPEWGEYKKNNTQILRLVRSFRDLPMNIIMTAAATYTQDEFKRFVYQPSLTGKLSKQVQGFMDIVGFLVVVEDNNRRMFVQPSAKYDAKNRLSRFKGTHFDNPTVLSILQAVGLYEGPSVAAPAQAAGTKAV